MNMPILEIVPASTALVVIDLQKGITAMPTEPHTPAVVIANTAKMADALRAKGGFIVWVRVAPSPDGKDMLKPILDAPSPWAGRRPADWADPVPELGAQPQDHVLIKKQWGAFHGTDLDLQLRRRGLTTIILAGIATCMGVESTARATYEHGYQQVFAEDAMASRSAAEHAHTAKVIFPRLGRVRSTAEVLAALG
jgi:nicotinamidase-related amidase